MIFSKEIGSSFTAIALRVARAFGESLFEYLDLKDYLILTL